MSTNRFVGLFRELIADAPDGMKMSRVAAVLFKKFTEVENKVVDGAGSGINIITPYDLQYLLTRHNFSLVLYK